MIATMVSFQMKPGMTADGIAAIQRERAGLYDATPGLISKTFWVDDAVREFGAFYLWESEAAADALFTDEWKQRIPPVYGVDGVAIRYLVATARSGS